MRCCIPGFILFHVILWLWHAEKRILKKEKKILGNPYSSVKVFHHSEVLDAISKGDVFAPFYIRLKPTNVCNHHCAYCTYGSGNTNQKTDNRDKINHKDLIPWDKLQEIIGDMGKMGVKAITLSGGGEPLCYPHIKDAVKRIKQNGIDLSLISNGSLLRGEVAKEFYDAKWVRISFDSPDETEYLALRGLSENAYRIVVDNIADFAKEKSAQCTLGVNYVVSKANYHRVYQAAELLRDLGVNNVKFAAVIDNEKGYHLSIKDEVLSQIYKAINDFSSDSFRIINSYENDWMDKNFTTQNFDTCYTCRLVTVIGADQKIYLCHTRAYDSSAEVADLHKGHLRDIWFSDSVQKKLTELCPDRDCKNFCVYEERNKMIQAYFDVDMNHVNFI